MSFTVPPARSGSGSNLLEQCASEYEYDIYFRQKCILIDSHFPLGDNH